MWGKEMTMTVSNLKIKEMTMTDEERSEKTKEIMKRLNSENVTVADLEAARKFLLKAGYYD